MQRMTLEQIDAKLVRWRRKLTRALNTINKLERQRARVARAASIPLTQQPLPTPPAAVVLPPPPVAPPAPPATPLPVDDGAIPGFLKRSSVRSPEEARAAVEEQKAAERKASSARSAAKKKDKLAKAPLSGRAAMAFIRDMASST